MINKACPTPAPAGTMETLRANGDAGREQLLESTANEMDYINPFCCCSSWSLSIEVTDCTSHRGKILVTLCYNGFRPVYPPMGKCCVSNDDWAKSCEAVVEHRLEYFAEVVKY